MDAPNISPPRESAADAIEIAELKSVVACVLGAHAEAIAADGAAAADQKTLFAASIPCAEKYEVKTVKLCADERRIAASCAPDRADKIVSNYIITTTDVVTDNGAGKILELLGRDYPYAANFGIVQIADDKIPYILSSAGTKREISRALAAEAKFSDGQLAYITQYAVSGKKAPAVSIQLQKIKCGRGELPVFRQNQWACVSSNIVPICIGDFIWDNETSSCVPDSGKRPLCQSNQTAVMVDEIWECIGAEQPRECPAGYIAQLNYGLMEWECVINPAAQRADDGKKCDKIYGRIYGGGAAALRGSLVSCNDCERMMVHDDCTAECVPDAAKISSRRCYAGQCQNFYFGFPDPKYIAAAQRNIPSLAGIAIPIDDSHSRNRRFNCTECPNGVNTVASMPPYVIICQ